MCQPTFCEMQSTGAEPVKGFDNGKSMPRMEAKFRTASETNLFLSKRFKIGITDISKQPDTAYTTATNDSTS